MSLCLLVGSSGRVGGDLSLSLARQQLSAHLSFCSPELPARLSCPGVSLCLLVGSSGEVSGDLSLSLAS